MGSRVGFIQNLIGPRGQRRVGGVNVSVDAKEGCLAGWLAGCRVERLHRPSAVLFPRLLGAGLQPRWVRPWSLLLAEGSARQEWTSTLRRVLPTHQRWALPS